jgi:predicted TPR repeat methyltransferase
MAAFDAGLDDEALEICRLWTLGVPEETGPYFSMARVYRRQGNVDEAARCYLKVLELVPEGRTAEHARKALEDLKKKPPTPFSARKVP